MPWILHFYFPSHPRIILSAYVNARDKNEAKEKFKRGYPHLAECEIAEVVLYES